MAKDSGKLIDFTLTPPKTASTTPTMGGMSNGMTIKGQDLQKRTSSSAACDEKLFENHPEAPTRK